MLQISLIKQRLCIVFVLAVLTLLATHPPIYGLAHNPSSSLVAIDWSTMPSSFLDLDLKDIHPPQPPAPEASEKTKEVRQQERVSPYAQVAIPSNLVKTCTCPYCKKSFSRPSDCERHIRVHTGEKPYVCKVCGRCFSQSSSCDKHVRVHTREKPYPCRYCSKMFTQSCNRKTHEQGQHGLAKPYACKKCTKSFATAQQLQAHDYNHTGKVPYTCQFCQAGFLYVSSKKQHEARCTKRKNLAPCR